MGNHDYTITAYSGINILMENITYKNAFPDSLRKVAIDYCKKTEKANPHKNSVNTYIAKSFNKDIPYKVLTFEKSSNNNYAFTVGIKCKRSKSCCFYFDDRATERVTKFIKNVNAKHTTSTYFYTQRLLINRNLKVHNKFLIIEFFFIHLFFCHRHYNLLKNFLSYYLSKYFGY